MITVAVVDDHPHVAIALRALLDETTDIRLVAEARQGSELLALVKRSRPHVVLLDLLIEPEFDALSTVRELRTQYPEQDVLRLAQRGLPNPQIAQSLHLSAGTVRNHLSTIYRKLGVHTRHEALTVAKERGLI